VGDQFNGQKLVHLNAAFTLAIAASNRVIVSR
jgi:hypothetical protein